MDINLLKTFLVVRDCGNFSNAAAQLKITQAAVSLRIKQLEKLLDGPLFVRYRNNLQLTVSGERLVLYAENILAEWEKAKVDIGLRKKSKKVVRFGATSGFCSILLNKSLSPIYEGINDMILRVESHDEETLHNRLASKRIDLALLYEDFRGKEYISSPVSSVELVLVSTVEGQTMAEALGGVYVTVEWGSFFNLKFLTLSAEMPAPVLQATESTFAMNYILAMGGSAYLPYRLVENYLGSTLYLVEDARVLQQPIYATYHLGSKLSADIKILIDIMRENAKPAFTTLEAVIKEFDTALDYNMDFVA